MLQIKIELKLYMKISVIIPMPKSKQFPGG